MNSDKQQAQEAIVSSVWYTSKLLEKSVREASTWIQETVSAKRDEADEAVQKLLNDFELLKKDQAKMVKLMQVYTKQQQALQQTEAGISLLLTEMGQHENSPSIRECLTVAGGYFGRINKQREVLIKSSESAAASLDNFAATAIEDLKMTVRKYDTARREFLASDKTMHRSKSAQTNVERRDMLQGEMDEATNAYRMLSWQVGQKVKILSHHRSREVCIKISDMMQAEHGFVDASNDILRACDWKPFVPNEKEANAVISECYAQARKRPNHSTPVAEE